MLEGQPNKDIGNDIIVLTTKLAVLEDSLKNVAGELDQRHGLFSDSDDPREDVKRAITDVQESLRKLRKTNPKFNQ
ncbi:MAG: hypothetical protein AAB734_03780 [Patescibacteria group bacterium]